MPFYDLTCVNSHEQIDVLLKLGERPPCPICGETTETLWRNANNVIGDDIAGGMWIDHGLCDEKTGAPVKYYSKSAMVKEAKRRGLKNIVKHVGDKGSDRNKHTTRWI